ncbi:MAG: prepilin-type N-terminal cleavage/methylation domain-containing protein [Candidatus Omnitrophica bacterium]|nr:prepilin-type N-terminal cleavage/methylation domain-containing protein [Candidatus Omnitrophota bacterium]
MREKGFTLIELLVVISVIAILIGIAVPRFRGMQDEANTSKARAEARVLQTAVESYYMNQTPNAYPATVTTLCAAYLNDATPLIVNDVLTDPFRTGGAEYNYIRSANGRYYVIFSYGRDGAADITGISDAGVLAGTDDDDLYATNGTGF